MRKRFLFVLAFVFIIVLTGCGGKIDFSSREIEFDGYVLNWDSVVNESYEVYVDDNLVRNLSSSNTFSLQEKNKSFEVEIKVYINDKYVDSLPLTTFTYVPKVDEVEFNPEGEITWQSSTNASKYIVTLNGAEYETSQPKFSNFIIGDNDFTILPLGYDKTYFSYPSNEFSYEMLERVKEINYDNQKITWDVVSSANSYDVYVNGTFMINTQFNYYTYEANKSDFSVRVKAKGNGVSQFNSKYSDVEEFIYLNAPSALNMEYGVLSWEAIPKATSYLLSYGGTIVEVDTTSYAEIPSGTEYDIKVKAISSTTKFFSEWSLEKTVFILPAPVINWNNSLSTDGQENQNIIWDAINGAAGYTVKVKDPEGNISYPSFGVSQLMYSNPYNLKGTYEISVSVLSSAAQTTVYDSCFSNIISVVRLGSPNVGTNYLISDPNNLANGFTITYDSVAFASGYQLLRSGELVSETTGNQINVTNLSDYATFERQNYTYVLKSLGQVIETEAQTKVYLDSLTSNSFSFDITILETPIDHVISGYIFNWEAVDQAAGYNVLVGSTNYERLTPEFDMNLLNPGTYTISVGAMGNGSNILPSKQSPTQNIFRLSAPINLRIKTQDAGEGQLDFDDVEHALSYTVAFDLGSTEVPYDGLGNVSQSIATNGTIVTVRAVANYLNTTTNIYYLSSPMSTTKQFTKLAAPTFSESPFTNSTFSWLHSSNINVSEYTPLYSVYNGNMLRYNTGVNGTNMNISGFAAGTYTFYVKAIGNGTEYINSEMSLAVTVRKLEQVDFVITNNVYQWGSVSGASAYEIYIDNNLAKIYTHTPGTTFTFDPSYTELKSYEVKIITIGDNGVSSIDSDPFIYTQATQMLTTPGFTFSYSEAAYIESGTINVTVTVLSPNALGYAYVIGGALNESSNATYSYTPSQPGVYVISVYALGGAIVDEIYYINSLSQGGNSTYTLTILTPPTQSSVEMDIDGRITWGAVINAVAYEYRITLTNATVISGTTTRLYYDLDITNETYVKIEIRAVGSGNIVTSTWVVVEKYLDN